MRKSINVEIHLEDYHNNVYIFFNNKNDENLHDVIFE